MKNIHIYTITLSFFCAMAIESCRFDSTKSIKSEQKALDSLIDRAFGGTESNKQIYYDSLFKKIDYCHWWKLQKYFPVYRYSDSLTGIGIDLLTTYNIDTPNPFEVLYNAMPIENNNMIVDSFPGFIVYEFPQKNLFMMDSLELYVVCTKGVAKSTPQKVLIASADNCGLQLIFKMKNINRKYGEPLLASYEKPNIEYKIDNRLDKLIKEYHYNCIGKADYYDSFVPIQFASDEDKIFLYGDDFLWRYGNKNSKTNFPSRMILKVQNGKLHHYWDVGIDLFGVPCD